MVVFQRTCQIKLTVVFAYKLEARGRSLFTLQKGEEQEVTQLTEWRGMEKTTKGSFLG